MFVRTFTSVSSFAANPVTRTAAKEFGKFAVKYITVAVAAKCSADALLKSAERAVHKWDHEEKDSADNCATCDSYKDERTFAERVTKGAGKVAEEAVRTVRKNWVTILLFGGSYAMRAHPVGTVLGVGAVAWEIGKVTWSVRLARREIQELRASKLKLEVLTSFQVFGEDMNQTFDEMQQDPLHATSLGIRWVRNVAENEPSKREIRDMVNAVEKFLQEEGLDKTSQKNFLSGVKIAIDAL